MIFSEFLFDNHLHFPSDLICFGGGVGELLVVLQSVEIFEVVWKPLSIQYPHLSRYYVTLVYFRGGAQKNNL